LPNPNTFIVGAPKCGTTALASYLADHPNVFMSSPKEPHHFVHSEMPTKSNYPELGQYLSLFQDSTKKHTVVAEASVWYLYSKVALKQIAAFNPDAKIIMMLRRPDEMVYSMHSQGVVTLQENIKDFEDAWKLSIGNQTRSYSNLCKEPLLLRYDQIAKYGKQLQNARKYFPDDQIHVVFFEDFKLKTAFTYNGILRFLNLETDGREHFPVVNPNTELRNEIIGTILKKKPVKLMPIIAQIKRLLGIEKLGIKKKLTHLNQKKIERNVLLESLRKEIITVYREDIELLASITGRNLSHWLS